MSFVQKYFLNKIFISHFSFTFLISHYSFLI